MKAHLITTMIILITLTSTSLLARNQRRNSSEKISNTFYKPCLASQNQGIFQSQVMAQLDQDSASPAKPYPEYRSESTATLLAVFPGFFVHGLGHFYAGDYTTGAILLGLEVFTVPLLVSGGAHLAFGRGDPVSIAIGIIGFVGGWFYDFIHARGAVRKHNDKIRGQIRFSSDRSNDIGVSLTVMF